MRAMHLAIRRICVAALSLMVAWLVGCAPLGAPRVDGHSEVAQKLVRAVGDWDLLAQSVATRVAQAIAAWPQGEHPIHVSAAGTSDFDKGFVKLLRVHLLGHGVALSEGPAAVQLQAQTQLVDPMVAGGSMHAQVLVTTLLTNDGLYLTGTADVYDIERGDAFMYAAPSAPSMKTWKVVTP